jgi:hypothetical protein
MAKLTAKARKAIPKKDFALPGGRYPIEDKSHARNALARASGKLIESKVRAKVHAKYPDIGPSSKAGESKGDRKSRLDKLASGK